jgi:branched-chain amino acid transport system ATP-binding protein
MLKIAQGAGGRGRRVENCTPRQQATGDARLDAFDQPGLTSVQSIASIVRNTPQRGAVMTATKPTESNSPPLLSLSNVVAGYGAGDILKGVSLKVWEGQVTCLIGPNGAGKSTVLKCISGLLKPKAGTVTFGGKDVTASSPRAKLGLGLVHVPQDRSLFPHMSVWDNLLMGGYSVRDHNAVRGRIEEAIAMFPILGRRRHTHAGSLSGGEQKQVEIARTLLLNPHLIMLDEPSIGLDPKSRKLVFEAVGALAASGRTVLLVEQNARSGLAASHVGAVLEAGVVRLVRAAGELLTDPDVARLYLGGTPQSPSEARTREIASSGLRFSRRDESPESGDGR